MNDYNYYNDRVDSAAAERLLDLNRRFYESFGRDFSATRLRLQPGVKRLLETLRGGENILDLGCGNGELARALSRRAFHGSYLGLDRSPVLLADANASAFSFPVRFAQADLSDSSWPDTIASQAASAHPPFDVVMCFAVLHHIPGRSLRSDILCQVRELLADRGRLMLSNWIFTRTPRLRGRIHPWSSLSLKDAEVDPGDYLLDWRRGGVALRYVHEFSEPELDDLARSSGFLVADGFYSDGADRRSSLYEVWSKAAP